jgi:predicted RNA binding protein YcfA (HicA-like mRNA interferase family)
MASEPAVSGKEAARALKRLGFRLDRVEGSHHMFVKPGLPHTVAVPVHGSHALPKGTLASIIRIARLSRKDFFAAIR